MSFRPILAALILLSVAGPVAAQQRPLITEDPEPIGAGRILIEGGVDMARDQEYPVSGLQGTLWRVPTIGLSFGLSAIAELQFDGGFHDSLTIHRRRAAPLDDMLTVDGDHTSDVEDIIVATKVRFLYETANRPAM